MSVSGACSAFRFCAPAQTSSRQRRRRRFTEGIGHLGPEMLCGQRGKGPVMSTDTTPPPRFALPFNGGVGLQARLTKKSFLFGHLFLNIADVFCVKKRVGHACICHRMNTGSPVLKFYPPPKLAFPPPKFEIENKQIPTRELLFLSGFCSKNASQNGDFLTFFFQKNCHADHDSREQQATLSN